jgi:hypothetical protein
MLVCSALNRAIPITLVPASATPMAIRSNRLGIALSQHKPMTLPVHILAGALALVAGAVAVIAKAARCIAGAAWFSPSR